MVTAFLARSTFGHFVRQLSGGIFERDGLNRIMTISEQNRPKFIAGLLWEASLLLKNNPHDALDRATEIFRQHPDNRDAIILRIRALRVCEDWPAAEAAARQLVTAGLMPGLGIREMALVNLARDEPGAAHRLLEEGARTFPYDAGAWSLLADLRDRSGDALGAQEAVAASQSAAELDPECLEAALAINEDRLADAEHLLRMRLRDFPTEVTTIRLMAELATRLDRFEDAERLLRRALQIASDFDAARELLARNLQRSHRVEEALAEVTTLLERDEQNLSLQMLRASLLVKTGDQATARDVYQSLLSTHPGQPKAWMSLGHVLKTLGQREEGVSAYRQAIEQMPTLGEAWWSLANLKMVRFTEADIAAMEQGLEEAQSDEDRFHLHFALGKACEDRRQYQSAFRHWTQGNGLRRKSIDYNTQEVHDDCARGIAFFDASVLAAIDGHPSSDPIFVVGMPRSGSTLVEQILASHSQVEGTTELPDMMEIAARLARRARETGVGYPEILSRLSRDERVALGREYLDRTRIHRKTGRPYFIDKMPNNWANVGLIRTILPSAHIIDTRRHPAGNCLSMWKQHFARGQGFSYDLSDLARYYRDYTQYMEHFSRVEPNLMYRIIYERLVSNSEVEIRGLLDFIGLPFEPACLSFWKNDRAVRTPSSEQVRQPIFTDAIDHWRNFEPWLNPLLVELAPLIRDYPV